jgi:parvulin-like peptidyl-prolyl isomerase
VCWWQKKTETRVALAALLLLASLAFACSSAPPASDVVVASVGERRITFGEFERYLSSNALESADDRVMSRMLDALVEQTILLNEAERRGLEISEDQIDLYLGQGFPLDPENGSVDVQRQQIRQRLKVLDLQQQLVGKLPEPTEFELHAHVRQMGWAGQRRVRLRSLRFESAEDAVRVSELIATRRMTFAEAVVTYEADPGQGLPLDLTWSSLSPEIQAVVEPLKPGDVSDPVEFTGEMFVFQLDAWLSGDEIEEELLRRARSQLAGSRERAARRGLLQKLSAASPTRIHEDRLPFRYEPAPG